MMVAGKKNSGLFLAAFGLLHAAQASAQEQTPENAHRFLNIVLQDQFAVDPFISDDGRFADDPGLQRLSDRLRLKPISSYTNSSICQGDLQLVPPHVYMRDSLVNGSQLGPHRTMQDRLEVVLDWRKVSSVTADGSNVVLNTSQQIEPSSFGRDEPAPSASASGSVGPSSSQQFVFRVADADIATRAAFAAQVIRLHCDPAASTGF